jgi:hypothetical protein
MVAMRGSITFHLARPDREQIPAGGAQHRRWLRLWGAVSAAWRQLRAGSESVRALAALDDEDICHLSEAGRRLRQSARGHYRPLATNRPSANSGERQ